MENEEYDVYEFHQDDLYSMLDAIKEDSEFLETVPTQDMCEAWKQLFKPEDGLYEISDVHVDQLIQYLVDDALQQLVKMGDVEMTVGEGGEFLFSVTQQGLARAKELEDTWGKDGEDG